MYSNKKIISLVVILSVLAIFVYAIFSTEQRAFDLVSASDIKCSNLFQDPPGIIELPQVTDGTQDPPGWGSNNCWIDSLAKMNADKHGKDEGTIRYEMIICMMNKGYRNPIIFGLPSSARKDIIACKISVMGGMGVTENPGTGKGPGYPPSPNQGDSPFEDNCPRVGEKISIMVAGGPGSSSGHSTTCTVVSCSPGFGQAVLSCQESNYGPDPNTPPYPVNVGPDGRVSTPTVPNDNMEGGTCIGWVRA